MQNANWKMQNHLLLNWNVRTLEMETGKWELGISIFYFLFSVSLSFNEWKMTLQFALCNLHFAIAVRLSCPLATSWIQDGWWKLTLRFIIFQKQSCLLQAGLSAPARRQAGTGRPADNILLLLAHGWVWKNDFFNKLSRCEKIHSSGRDSPNLRLSYKKPRKYAPVGGQEWKISKYRWIWF